MQSCDWGMVAQTKNRQSDLFCIQTVVLLQPNPLLFFNAVTPLKSTWRDCTSPLSLSHMIDNKTRFPFRSLIVCLLRPVLDQGDLWMGPSPELQTPAFTTGCLGSYFP
jgi:hypothetical protein